MARASGVLLIMLGASQPAPADACGGAFFPASATETVAVRGHQMAMAISKKQTVVWDRIEVDGNPSELAWVIPVHEGAKLELSSEGWFVALATHTAAKVREAGGASSGGGGSGCACGGGADGDTVGADLATGGGAKGNGVTVLERADVGPYDTVRLRATDPGSARAWLVGNGFRIPEEIGPVLDEYTTEGFDFIALRVRPGAAAVGLQPLRLTTPGADPTLPLRMSRAGVKTSAALTLYVLGEGRYRAQGFEEAAVDRSKITFDRRTETSSYDQVVEAQLAAGDGRRFVVEFARNDPDGFANRVFEASGSCVPTPDPPSLGGGTDAGALLADAGDLDAGDLDAGDAGDLADGGADAGDTDAGETDAESPDAAPDASPPKPRTCPTADLAAARDGITGPFWVTRLRARLPASAFATDLRLEASPAQEAVSSEYVIASGGGAMVARVRPSGAGSVALFGATLAGLVAMLGRRRRER